ncbi:hypothetical protein DCS_06010 [Drechmeria coniospora]|uniref:Uncharacterized protein n=1 Tax=Drechmeria coniospora TaxID=98403 RepID=A0A151GAF2_DRECN|nr:hypothetical protein DCS_06010 [Drechmeria coniospora]KYK54055.1 hypothetical protein DCS_06010 [Drechmeria coniospora]ODA78890.1 hypothetical protein RJ55_04480 [Drechmeria coniospora]
MALYLTMHYFARAVIRQMMDKLEDWTWCMAGDATCQACPYRWDLINAKSIAIKASGRKPWMPRLTVCYQCFQPQTIYCVADPEAEQDTCQCPDMVMPLRYGAFKRPGREA